MCRAYQLDSLIIGLGSKRSYHRIHNDHDPDQKKMDHHWFDMIQSKRDQFTFCLIWSEFKMIMIQTKKKLDHHWYDMIQSKGDQITCSLMWSKAKNPASTPEDQIKNSESWSKKKNLIKNKKIQWSWSFADPW